METATVTADIAIRTAADGTYITVTDGGDDSTVWAVIVGIDVLDGEGAPPEMVEAVREWLAGKGFTTTKVFPEADGQVGIVGHVNDPFTSDRVPYAADEWRDAMAEMVPVPRQFLLMAF